MSRTTKDYPCKIWDTLQLKVASALFYFFVLLRIAYDIYFDLVSKRNCGNFVRALLIVFETQNTKKEILLWKTSNPKFWKNEGVISDISNLLVQLSSHENLILKYTIYSNCYTDSLIYCSLTNRTDIQTS